MSENTFHPTGITVEIVGTQANTQGRSCEEHDTCGSVLAEDTVVRFRKVQVITNGKEESAIAVYHVSDGIDCCRVGFLQRHLVKHWKQYDGVLAQIIDVYCKQSESPSIRRKVHHNKGCCVAAIISSLSVDTISEIARQKRRRRDEPDSDDAAEVDDDDGAERQRTNTVL